MKVADRSCEDKRPNDVLMAVIDKVVALDIRGRQPFPVRPYWALPTVLDSCAKSARVELRKKTVEDCANVLRLERGGVAWMRVRRRCCMGGG
jgi:hypothetical protein